MQTKDAPSSNRFSHFYCQQAIVVDVNRKNWTCALQTVHGAQTMPDVQWASSYHHYTGGEGYHYMPEVGAHCWVAIPNDNTPPFIMGFRAPPAVITAAGSDPLRSSDTPGGSSTDVSYQSNRPDLNPGDIALTTRDGSFVILRRGGVLQIGATALAQRIFVPIRNFIHDYAENYELATPGGDVCWIVDRPELDPAGKPPCSWSFHMREYATDKNATVRVRHLPLAEAGAKKAAWEVTVAPNGIDRDTGAAASATYSMLILTSGETAEMVAANRTTEIKGNDTLKVGGNQTTTVTGTSALSAKNVSLTATVKAVVAGKQVHIGADGATEPALLGNAFLQWAQAALVDTPMGPMPLNAATLSALAQVLSKTVMLK
jgi:hypothetical protein